MTRVTFLGVGAAIPGPGRTNSAYLIEAGGARILFDCGPAILQQLAAAGRSPAEVTHVFVSHAHGDHALGYPMFRLWWTLEALEHSMKPPVLVASAGTWPHLHALWRHSYADIPHIDFPWAELPADRPGTHELTPAVRLSTWPMIHSSVYPVLGARFEADGKVLAFTADTTRCAHIVELARGADLLVHDSRHALTVEPALPIQSRFHCAAREAGEYATKAGAKALALIHIGPEYEGKHDALVAEARGAFGGPVFAPAPGEVWEG
jgi:ribonuclease Z